MTFPIPALRLLLVEDNPADADLARERLAGIRDAAVEVLHAQSLRDAVELLRGPLPDAIILDLNLPDSMGLPTYRRIRQVAPDVPTVVLTGTLPAELRDELEAEGVAEQFVKSDPGLDGLRHSLLGGPERGPGPATPDGAAGRLQPRRRGRGRWQRAGAVRQRVRAQALREGTPGLRG